MLVEQPGIALPLPGFLPLNINHFLKHLGFVPKAKREEESVGEEKGGKERRILYINSFIHSTNICEVSVVAHAWPRPRVWMFSRTRYPSLEVHSITEETDQ